METKEPIVETGDSAPVEPDGGSAESPAAQQLAAVSAERDRLIEEKNDLMDRLLRRQAEFDNFRRRAEREKADVLEYATGPGFFQVLHDRAIALVDDAVEAGQIDDDRARAQLEAAQAELEAIERGESTADRWQVEQRIRHAENQLSVSGHG